MKAFEKEFLEFLQGVYKSVGFDSLSAKLYSQLFLEPKEVSIEELSKRTGYSLASISNKMRLMEGIGVAKRIKKPGTKRVYYFVEKDMIKIQISKMETLAKKMFEPSKNFAKRHDELKLKEKLNKDEKEKLDIIHTYYKQMEKLEKATNAFKEELLKWKPKT